MTNMNKASEEIKMLSLELLGEGKQLSGGIVCNMMLTRIIPSSVYCFFFVQHYCM